MASPCRTIGSFSLSSKTCRTPRNQGIRMVKDAGILPVISVLSLPPLKRWKPRASRSAWNSPLLTMRSFAVFAGVGANGFEVVVSGGNDQLVEVLLRQLGAEHV